MSFAACLENCPGYWLGDNPAYEACAELCDKDEQTRKLALAVLQGTMHGYMGWTVVGAAGFCILAKIVPEGSIVKKVSVAGAVACGVTCFVIGALGIIAFA